ncbi:MAG: hypothetical protein JXA66_03745 [Oligoflexia bacterium]|nr:hypothetical protein [Oligoflexia bacterium]
MVILIVIKDLMLHELDELIEAGKLQSVSECMTIHNPLGTPPLVYPYSIFPMLTGSYPATFSFEMKNTTSIFNLYPSSPDIRAEFYSKLESVLSLDPIRMDKKTWAAAVSHIEANKARFICITLESLHHYNIHATRRVKEMVATFYFFIDHIVHTLNNLVPNIKPLIIITGSGKIIRNKLKMSMYHLDNSKSNSPIPGLLLVNSAEDKIIDTRNPAQFFSQGADMMAVRKGSLWNIYFPEGSVTVNTVNNIMEIEHHGSHPLFSLPPRITPREIYQFTRFTEYPELPRHIYDIFSSYPSYDVIISNGVFHATNLEIPVLVNKNRENIQKTADIFDLIKKELQDTISQTG